MMRREFWQRQIFWRSKVGNCCTFLSVAGARLFENLTKYAKKVSHHMVDLRADEVTTTANTFENQELTDVPKTSEKENVLLACIS